MHNSSIPLSSHTTTHCLILLPLPLYLSPNSHTHLHTSNTLSHIYTPTYPHSDTPQHTFSHPFTKRGVQWLVLLHPACGLPSVVLSRVDCHECTDLGLQPWLYSAIVFVLLLAWLCYCVSNTMNGLPPWAYHHHTTVKVLPWLVPPWAGWNDKVIMFLLPRLLQEPWPCYHDCRRKSIIFKKNTCPLQVIDCYPLNVTDYYVETNSRQLCFKRIAIKRWRYY